MSKILIVYGTTQGQTQKIAFCISEELMKQGHSFELMDSGRSRNRVEPKDFDGVILGASVHAGGYQRSLKKWASAHAQELNSVPSAFFSVCLGILQKEPAVRQEEERIVRDFLKSVNWRPSLEVIFAGALSYTRYNPLLRWWMKRIAKKAGGDTDTSKDYEYTDWNQVAMFVREFLSLVGTSSRPEVPSSGALSATL